MRFETTSLIKPPNIIDAGPYSPSSHLDHRLLAPIRPEDLPVVKSIADYFESLNGLVGLVHPNPSNSDNASDYKRIGIIVRHNMSNPEKSAVSPPLLNLRTNRIGYFTIPVGEQLRTEVYMLEILLGSTHVDVGLHSKGMPRNPLDEQKKNMARKYIADFAQKDH